MPFDIDFDTEPISKIFETCIYLLTDALEASSKADVALKIGIARLRLTRWGEAVNIRNDFSTGQEEMDSEDINAIRKALVQMIGTFERYSASDDDDTRRRPRLRWPWLAQSPFLELAQIMLERCGEVEGSLVDRALRYEELDGSPWRNAALSVSKLEDILPAAQRQRDLCAAEKLRFPEEWIRTLQKVAFKVDPWWVKGVSVDHLIVDTADLVRLNQFLRLNQGIETVERGMWTYDSFARELR